MYINIYIYTVYIFIYIYINSIYIYTVYIYIYTVCIYIYSICIYIATIVKKNEPSIGGAMGTEARTVATDQSESLQLKLYSCMARASAKRIAP